MHHGCNGMYVVLLQSLKNCWKQPDLLVLFDGLCLHILRCFGIGSNLCKTYISPWKWKKPATFDFYQLSQQLVKEIRHPACWLCCMLIVLHTDGRELAGRSFPVQFLQHEHLNMGFFQLLTAHRATQARIFSSRMNTCVCTQMFTFTWLRVFASVESRLSFDVFLPIGAEIPDDLGKLRRQGPQSCLLVCLSAV